MDRIVASLLSLAVLAGCGGSPEIGAAAIESDDYIEYHDDRATFDVSYPREWSRAEQQLTILGNPIELLALATFPLKKGGGCAPKAALEDAESDDAIVFLVEFTATAGKRLPPRPASFEPLRRPKMSNCWDAPVSTYLFRDSGGRFQIDVWLGKDVTDDTMKDVIHVLDSIKFGTRERTGSFFERVNTVLQKRGFGTLRPADNEKRARAAPLRELRAKVRRRLANKARLIDVTIGIFVSTSERLGRYRKLTYVVHTGPFATGDCLDFYDAKTLHYDIGSCFLTDRDL